MKGGFKRLALGIAASLAAGSALPQRTADIGFESVGRAAPLLHDASDYTRGGFGGFGFGFGFGSGGAARSAEPPEGIVPLERDLFTTDDCYAYRGLSSEPRYFRCLSAGAIDNRCLAR